MNNYIVRVYRYEKERPRSVIGIVETVGVEGKKAFTNIDELWEILSPSHYPFKRTQKTGGKGQKNKSKEE